MKVQLQELKDASSEKRGAFSATITTKLTFVHFSLRLIFLTLDALDLHSTPLCCGNPLRPPRPRFGGSIYQTKIIFATAP